MDAFQQDVNNKPCISISETTWPVIQSIKTSRLWALVDGANWPEIQSILADYAPHHICLYSTADPDSQRSAPWLICVESDSEIQSLLLQRDPNTHAVIFFHSEQEMRQLRDHFRHFTMLWTPVNPNAPVYFRFYDPRVLLDMVSALNIQKLSQFYSGIESFYVPLTFQMQLPASSSIATEELGKRASSPTRFIKLALENVPDLAQHNSNQSFKVNPKEYQMFIHLLNQRSVLNLAVALFQAYDEQFPAYNYVDAAQLAYQNASKYRFTTQNEMTVLADCFLWLGHNFPENSPDAAVLLNDPQSQGLQHLYAWLQSIKTAAPLAIDGRSHLREAGRRQ
ncbi:DUF4123 domain-containing protein [Nitrincola nitratireducens]|uniref:DUF4123 domain-containing protein n=1 Tax=Nitrincola nitratireducens TaxID=1229521 RepID=W9VGS6_9GAMM|nr:DUF4123 domain-containing protein [Nitrincola nitratireducens]EXJ09825.1 hypothetical protein D791_03153 [Nitrincola nitratireducens]